jgi:conjugative relaxase-like TrwC/TraI family protein
VRLLEPDGAWLGSGADELGLRAGIVVPDALDTLLAGIDPVHGTVLDPRHGRVRNAAFDCTFSPPKSVSVLHALAGAEVSAQVRAAHEASVEATLGYLEHRAAAVRRSRGGERRAVAASGLCAASFVHRSSRAGDPHLHSHVLVANLAADDSGSWSALDGRGLFLHARAASALYASHLRAELVRRLDVTFDPSSPSGDIAGIERRVVLEFSRRSRAIAAELSAAHERGPASTRVASFRTRPAKDLTKSYEELRAQWWDRARSIGVQLGALEERTGLGLRDGTVRPRVERPARSFVELPLGRLGRRDVIVCCAAQLRSAPVEAVERAVDELVASDRLLSAGRARPALSNRRSRRLPAGVEEERFVTPETLQLVRSWEHLLAEPTSRPPGLRVVHVEGEGALARAACINELVGVDAAAGCRLLAVISGGMRRAAGMEALTGVRSVPAGMRLPLLGAAALVVEEDLVHDHPGAAVQVLARAAAGAPVTVVCRSAGSVLRGGRPPTAPPHPDELAPGQRPGTAGRLERLGVEGVPLVVASRTSAVVDELLLDARRSSDAGERPVVVVPDRNLGAALAPLLPMKDGRAGPSGWLGAPSLPAIATPAEVTGLLSASPGRRLLVLGPARLLRRHDVERADRAHYAVLPTGLAASERRAALLEIAEPPALAARIGRLPAGDLAGRARWRDAALLASSGHDGVAGLLVQRDGARPVGRDRGWSDERDAVPAADGRDARPGSVARRRQVRHGPSLEL